MANTIKIKRSLTTATPPSLSEGELAYSENSKNLFIGTSGGNVSKIGGNTDVSKLATIEENADVTDTTNVTSAGALMDSEVTNLSSVKAFDTTDYATATQGTTADDALPKAGGTMSGHIAMSNKNITGVNQLQINDPGEGIAFNYPGGAVHLTNLDATPKELDFVGATKLKVGGTDVSMAHTHPYLPLSGGTLTGNLKLNKTDAKIILNDSSGSPEDQSVDIRGESIDTYLPTGEGFAMVVEKGASNTAPQTKTAFIVEGNSYADSYKVGDTAVIETDAKINWDKIKSAPTTYPPSTHNHDGRYVKTDPDGDGVCIVYNDSNPSIKYSQYVDAVGLAGWHQFGADGNVGAGAIRAKVVSADSLVHAKAGFVVGNIDLATEGSAGAQNAIRVIDSSGNVIFDNPEATTTSQSRGIIWTAYDKEGVTDKSDNAYIKQITNTAGMTGSVLEIKQLNDSNDGINLNTASNTGVRLNGNIILSKAWDWQDTTHRLVTDAEKTKWNATSAWHALMDATDDTDTIVNTVKEMITVFDSTAESLDLMTALNSKLTASSTIDGGTF